MARSGPVAQNIRLIESGTQGRNENFIVGVQNPTFWQGQQQDYQESEGSPVSADHACHTTCIGQVWSFTTQIVTGVGFHAGTFGLCFKIVATQSASVLLGA